MEGLPILPPIDDICTGVMTDTVTFYNDSYCFFCLLDGDARLLLGEDSYTLTGQDVFFIPPDTEYTIHASEPIIFFSTTFNYIFTEQILGSRAWENITCNSAAHRGYNDMTLAQQLASIATVGLGNRTNNRLYLTSQIFGFYHYLKCYHMVTPVRVRPEHLSEKQFKNIGRITAFIDARHAQPLTLGELAQEFHMTPQYMANFIKQALGQTFFEYLADIRLRDAETYVFHSSEPVFRIAAITGFPNQNSFIKAFTARHHISPDQWRDSHPGKASGLISGNLSRISSDDLARDYINNYITIRPLSVPMITESRAENITINTSVQKPCDRPWSMLVNLGYSRSFMHADYRRQLRQMQEQLHFKYGRLLRPFDIVQPVLVDGRQLYDFSRLFQILDFMKDIQILPFLELGNKLYKINTNSFDHIKVRPEDSPADYYEVLMDILPHFLRSSINRYGIDTVSQWKFELWTEHMTLIPGNESPEIYARHFSNIYKIIKELLPDCQVGGPGYNTYAQFSHFEAIMKSQGALDLVPDFITAYIYPYVQDREGRSLPYGFKSSMISPDKNIYRQRLTVLYDYCQKHYPDRELLITEYSADISSRNFINDSIYLATFIAKFNLDGLGLGRGFAYWLLSDIPLEYKDSNKILFGGNGLINRNGIYKPGYHAVHFLMDMGDKQIARGDNYLMTCSDPEHYQLMAYNYAHMHEDFCKDNTSYSSLKNPTAVFEQMEPRDITFTMHQLASGTYRIRHFVINNDYGNLLNEWIRLGAVESLQKNDVDYLQSCSSPHRELYFKDVRGTLEITCHLQPQQVDLYLIDLII